MSSTESKRLSGWEKADIVMKGLLPLAIAAVGYWSTSYLDSRQRTQATAQFYAELLTKREEADSTLRKEMFKDIIDKFLGPAQGNPENQVLGLELLAYNFHDSFDLGPLFKDVYRKVRARSPSDRDPLINRLITVSKEITGRQIASLADPDHRWDGTVDGFAEMRAPNFGSKTILDKDLPVPARGPKGQSQAMNMHLEALAVDPSRRAIRIRLQVRGREAPGTIVESVFWLSYFDFPMLDNTKLPDRQRLAVVLREFGADSAELTVVQFPESRASLKEKPYFDDLIEDVRQNME